MKKIEVDGWIASYLDKYDFGDPNTGRFEFEVYPKLEMAKIKLRGIAAPLKAHVTIIPEAERYCEWWLNDETGEFHTGCDSIFAYSHDVAPQINPIVDFNGCPYCLREIKEKK